MINKSCWSETDNTDEDFRMIGKMIVNAYIDKL